MVRQRALVGFVFSGLVLLASCMDDAAQGEDAAQDTGDVGPDTPDLAFSVYPERVNFGAVCVGEWLRTGPGKRKAEYEGHAERLRALADGAEPVDEEAPAPSRTTSPRERVSPAIEAPRFVN